MQLINEGVGYFRGWNIKHGSVELFINNVIRVTGLPYSHTFAHEFVKFLGTSFKNSLANQVNMTTSCLVVIIFISDRPSFCTIQFMIIANASKYLLCCTF